MVNKIDEILVKHGLETTSAANRAMQEYADWVAEKMSNILAMEKEREYNRGYVDCAKKFSGESLKPAPNES